MNLKSIRTWEQDGEWNAMFTSDKAPRIAGVGATEEEAVCSLVEYIVDLYSVACEQRNAIHNALCTRPVWTSGPKPECDGNPS